MPYQGLRLEIDQHTAWVFLTALDYHLAGSTINYRRPPSALLGFYEELAVQLAEYLEVSRETKALRITYAEKEEGVG